jgi:hypothetical protein
MQNEFKSFKNNYHVKVKSEVLDLATEGKISSGAFLFYSSLCYNLMKISYSQKNDKLLTKISFSNDQLMSITNTKETQMKKYLNELEDNGIIKREIIKKSIGMDKFGTTRKIEILISAYIQ